MVKSLISENYPELLETEVTVRCLYAHAARDKDGNPKGPALKFGNYPAAAIIRVNSTKCRIQGKRDCTIEIDGDDWESLSEQERVALLDHELFHLEVKRTKRRKNGSGGEIKTDSLGRPKLGCRQHDFQVGGFDTIVKRHKTASLEYQSQVNLAKRFHQQEFNWG
jgi:hypothetical protein